MADLLSGLRDRPVSRGLYLLLAWSAVGTGSTLNDLQYSRSGILLLTVGCFLVIAELLRRRSSEDDTPTSFGGCVAAYASAAVAALFFLRPRDASGPWLPASIVLFSSAAVLVTWMLLRRRGAPAHLAILAVALASIAMIRADPRPAIDVWHMMRAAMAGLSHGHDIYTVPWTDPTGHVHQHGYAYLPGSAVILLPFYVVFGDDRYGLVLAVVATAAILVRVSPHPVTKLAGLLVVLYPQTVFGLDRSWVDPLVLATACGAAFAALRGRTVWATLLLAACLTTKQTAWLLLPMAWVWPAFGRRRTLFAAGGALLFTAPWFLADPHAFYRSAFGYNMALPPRLDSLSLDPLAIAHGWTPGLAVSAALTAATALLALRRAPRTAYGFFLGSAAVMAVFDLTNKQSFYNEWWLAAGLVLAAVVFARAPLEVGEKPAQPADQAPERRLLSRSAYRHAASSLTKVLAVPNDGLTEEFGAGNKSVRTQEKRISLLTQLAIMQATIVGWLKARFSDEAGASLVEYALLLALIAVVAITALIFLGHTASNTLNSVANNLNNP